MKAKTMIGMGMKMKVKTKVKTEKKTAKKRVLPTAKRGDILPILPMLGALGSCIIGGAAGVIKAVSDSKATRRQLEELQRHYRAMEGHRLYLAPYKYGKGLHLGPYKRGQGVISKKKNVEKTLKMPASVTTDKQLDQLARRMHIPYFRGVFMLNALPMSDARRNESGIVNLDDARASGTYWVAYVKRDNHVIYFDSFGNLRPYKELVRYIVNGVTKIEYNRTLSNLQLEHLWTIMSAISPNGRCVST